jgi:glutamate carboxypeptidase
MHRFLILIAAALLSAAPATAALSPAEQRMIATVDAEQQRTVDRLAAWVNQNSGTLNSVGVRAVGDMMRREFEPLGFTVEWVDQKAANRAGHFIARHKGRGKKMLLIGHLDTVFEPDSGFLTWQREGDKGHGPGAADDKGGVAVIVAALRAMKSAGTLKNADITVFLTGDEEDAGSPISISRGDLVREGRRADIAIDFEGLVQENGADMGSVSRRSSDEWLLKVTARSAHSSGIFSPGTGYGAVYELARILDAFRSQLPEPNLTFNVGLVVAGATAKLDDGRIRGEATGKGNIIPGVAIARGDMRALSQEQIDRTRTKMLAIVAQSLPGAKAQITFDPSGYPPMAPTAGNRAILARLNRVNADLGLPPMGELEPIKRGAGDVSFVAADVDSFAGMGPASDGDHTSAERVDIPTIFKQAKRAAILMSRIAAERR